MSAGAKKILVIGSFVVSQTIRCDRLPVAGETLLGTDYDFGPGGKGFIQAIACARLGGDVRLVLPVGDDQFRQVALDTIAAERLADVRLVEKQGIHCGVGFVTLTAAGDNTILVAPGANAFFRPDDLGDLNELFDGVGLIVSQLEIPLFVTEHAFAIARKRGIRTMLNPAPGRPLPMSLLSLCDVLTANETEARLVLGLAADDPTSNDVLVVRLTALGVGMLVITQSARGAIVVNGATIEEVPSFPATSLDPTGADDSFNAAFAIGLVEGHSPIDAARRATAAGALATQKIGVISAIPTRTEVDELLASSGVPR